jgi:hypothetical protein
MCGVNELLLLTLLIGSVLTCNALVNIGDGLCHDADKDLEEFCQYFLLDTWTSYPDFAVKVVIIEHNSQSMSYCDVMITIGEFSCLYQSPTTYATGRITKDSEDPNLFWLEFSRPYKNQNRLHKWPIVSPTYKVANGECHLANGLETWMVSAPKRLEILDQVSRLRSIDDTLIIDGHLPLESWDVECSVLTPEYSFYSMKDPHLLWIEQALFSHLVKLGY